MNVLDTFTGIGAFSLAFERAGATIIAHSEIDKNRQALLAQRFPYTPQLGNIRNVTNKTIPDSVDVITGGTPCQDLSIAGRGQGLAGKKSGLWFEYIRAIAELKPKWVVWENVPNALSSNGGRDFAVILSGLAKCGYSVAWRVLDSKYFGVPQRRRRLFLVGHSASGRAAQVLFEPNSSAGNFNTRPKTWEIDTQVAGTLSKSASRTARTGNGNELDMLVYQYQSFGNYKPSDIVSTMRKGQRSDSTDLVIQQPIAFKWQAGGYAAGSMAAGNTSPTLSKTHTIAVKDRQLVRRLTPLECERLQAFPDNWTAGFSDTVRYQMLGDSITVTVAEWIAQRLINADKDTDNG